MNKKWWACINIFIIWFAPMACFAVYQTLIYRRPSLFFTFRGIYTPQYNISLRQHQPNERCMVCNFPTSKQGTSSPADAIIGMSNQNTNLLFMLRSIRAASCSATVVLFASPEIVELTNRSEFKDCGIWVIPVSVFKFSKVEIQVRRFKLYFEFLTKYIDLFRRVLFLDTSDSFFQGDPFTDNFTEDMLIISAESIKIKETMKYTGLWVKKVLKVSKLPPLYRKKSVLCCGLLAGGVGPIMSYLAEYVNQLATVRKIFYGFDQGVLNTIVYNSTLCSEVVPKCVISNFDTGDLSSIGSHLTRRGAGTYVPGDIRMHGESKAPAVIHQFNRRQSLIDDLASVCNTSSAVPIIL